MLWPQRRRRPGRQPRGDQERSQPTHANASVVCEVQTGQCAAGAERRSEHFELIISPSEIVEIERLRRAEQRAHHGAVQRAHDHLLRRRRHTGGGLAPVPFALALVPFALAPQLLDPPTEGGGGSRGQARGLQPPEHPGRQVVSVAGAQDGSTELGREIELAEIELGREIELAEIEHVLRRREERGGARLIRRPPSGAKRARYGAHAVPGGARYGAHEELDCVAVREEHIEVA